MPDIIRKGCKCNGIMCGEKKNKAFHETDEGHFYFGKKKTLRMSYLLFSVGVGGVRIDTTFFWWDMNFPLSLMLKRKWKC